MHTHPQIITSSVSPCFYLGWEDKYIHSGYTVIMQIVCGGKLSRFHRLASKDEDFPANLFFFIRSCFGLLYNHKSFPVNNKKSTQPRNFSTANNLHYTVYI